MIKHIRQDEYEEAPRRARRRKRRREAVTVVVNQQVDVGRSRRRWSPGLAMLLSVLLPGLGQMYKGQLFNGLAWLTLTVIGYLAFIVPGLILHLCCVLGAGMGDPYR